MSASLIIFLVAQCTVLLCLLGLTIQGFRTKPVWGLCPLLILLGPFASAAVGAPGIVAAVFVMAGFGGVLTFAGMHPRRAGVLGVIYVACFVTGLVLMFTSPAVVAFYGRINPRFASAVKTFNPSLYEAAQKMPEVDLPGVPKKPTPAPTPREVRDLAENETPFPAAKAPADPNAAPRAAYAKHTRELNTLFQQLNAERPRLKPGLPAVAAFNAKAAKYQQGLQALADEKTRLDALDHAANLNADAANALASLQASAAGEDYEAFAATLKKALADDRQTPSFAGIVALSRTTLAQATPDKISAGLQARAARTAQADFDKTTRQVQGIVNQVPPSVARPPDGSEVYHYGYHPGASKPDYNASSLIGTRESWKGEFVYMDDAPGVFYRSADCEFNPQTKYFYLSRNVPKKKLSDAEYQELTRLYHLLGQQEKAIAAATPPPGAVERISGDLVSLKAQLDGLAMK